VLSVIIVNYRSAADICNCLQSALERDDAGLFEWIVVDNQSNDNSEELICSRFPFVQWMDMGYNAGFARANNAGIRAAAGDCVLLLNPGTLILDHAISRSYALLSASPYIGCGVQLLNEDGSPQISGNYFMKGGLNYLLPLPYIGSLLKRLGNLAQVKKPNVPDASEEVEVDWINGAYLMVKKTAVDKAGLLDEDFFLYAEEAEWCSRLRKQGRLCVYGQFRVTHLQGEAANKTFGSTGKGYYNLFDRKGYQIMVSNFVRIRKQFGVPWFLFQLLAYSLAVPVFFIASFVEQLFRFRNPFQEFGRAAGFTGNVGRLWLLAPTIISSKPHFYKVL
jgi:GT2 family glycosyltransferase